MELADLTVLTSPAGRELLDQLSGEPVRPADLPALTTRLRRDHPAGLVAPVLTQVRLRDRARARFGAAADVMLFTPTGLEQATRATVARHRAERVARLAGGPVADLGCGIGGDLLALGGAGLTAYGFDADAVTAAVATANVAAFGMDDRLAVHQADVTDLDLGPYGAVTCDPSRRTASGRSVDPREYEPPWAFVRGVLASSNACVKVAPGIPHDLVPEGVEAEWVSDHGEVTEAALWSGDMRTIAGHRATLLPSGATLTRTATEPAPVARPGRFLYEPDGAVIRAGLVADVAAAVDGALLDPHIAYVGADRYVATPFATCYEVRDVLRFSLKRLRAHLRERGIGRVTLKKRGTAVDLDRLRHDLRLSGSEEAVVVLTRTAVGPLALICRRHQ